MWLPLGRLSAPTPQAPPVFTSAVKDWPPTVTCTVEPTGSVNVPCSRGVVSLVDRVGPPSIVTTGVVTSMVRVCVAVPVLPATVTEATTACGPSLNAAAVALQ